jgi:hypothetical protein
VNPNKHRYFVTRSPNAPKSQIGWKVEGDRLWSMDWTPWGVKVSLNVVDAQYFLECWVPDYGIEVSLKEIYAIEQDFEESQNLSSQEFGGDEFQGD